MELTMAVQSAAPWAAKMVESTAVSTAEQKDV